MSAVADLVSWSGAGSEGIAPSVLRAAAIYAAALVIVRVGGRRGLAQLSVFDVLLGIMLGSVLSRAVNGAAPILPTLAAATTLVVIHWLIATGAARAHAFSRLVKGSPTVIVRDGTVDAEALRKSGLSSRDLEEAVRLHGSVAGVGDVRLATLERNGKISVVPRE